MFPSLPSVNVIPRLLQLLSTRTLCPMAILGQAGSIDFNEAAWAGHPASWLGLRVSVDNFFDLTQ